MANNSNISRMAPSPGGANQFTLPPMPNLIDIVPGLARQHPDVKRYQRMMDEWRGNAEAAIKAAINNLKSS